MNDSQQAAIPDWKQFLLFGEKLLNAASVTDQCEWIRTAVREAARADSHIWLARPYYPLPGDTTEADLPDGSVPEVVRACYEKGRPYTTQAGIPMLYDFVESVDELAFPLMSQKNILGVLLVYAPEGEKLTSQDAGVIEGLSSHAALSMQAFRQSALKSWRFDQLTLVRSVSSRMANIRDLDDFYRQVTALIQNTFGFYYVAIFTLVENSRKLQYQASASSENEGPQLPVGFSVELGQGIVGTVAQTGQEIVSPDVANDSIFRVIETLPETRSEVALPLKTGEKVLGVLDIQSDEPRVIHEYDILVLHALADNIAKTIEGMELVSGLRNRANQVSAMLDVSRTLTSILEFEPLLEEIVRSIQKHFGYSYVHIFILHTGRRKLLYEAGTGARSQAAQKLHLAYDLDDAMGMIPWAARNGKTLLSNDISSEPLYRPSDLPPSNTLSELAIPLIYGGRVLGVMDLQGDHVNTFSESDVPLLESLGASIAIAIRNARLYQDEVWRRQVADSFREIAGLVSANLALDDLLDRILSELEQLLPCDATTIWLIDNTVDTVSSEGYCLRLAAAHNVDAGKIQGILDSKEETRNFLESVLGHNEPVIRQPSDPFGPLGLALGFQREYSSIAAPLRAGEKPLGILSLAHQSSGRYGSEARLISMTLANHASVAIQNNQLFGAAQEQAWIATILLQIAEATQSNQTVEELLDTMNRLTPMLVGVKKCAFFTCDENGQQFYLKASYGLNLPAYSELIIDGSTPAMARLMASKEAVFIDEPRSELNLPEASLSGDTGTLVMLPLLARGRLLGAYLVGHEAGSASAAGTTFDQQTLSLLQGIAQQTAMALENLELIEARQEEAYVTAVMLQVAQAVVSQNDLEDILDTIVHLIPILVGIDACAIYLWDEKSQTFRAAKVITGSITEENLLEGETFRPGEFPILDALRDQEQVVACKTANDDLSMDDWRDLDCLVSGDELENDYSSDASWVFGFPLAVKGSLYGAFLANESNVPAGMHQRRLEILKGISQQISMAIQNERLNHETVARERLEREIQLARQIQMTFLPTRLPRIPNWDVEIHWQTAREVGGDFYDVFRVAKDRLGVVIADVSDKGMPAALYMTVARTLIRAFSQKAESPARVLERVNRSLVVDSRDGLFVTAVFAILNTTNGQLTYANAGHNLPVLLSSSEKKATRLPKGGTALGISASSRLSDHQVAIQPGDTVAFYTDGVTESLSPDGELYGEERLLNALEAAPAGNAAALIDYLRHQLNDFRHGAPPSDDMTIVLLHYQGDPKDPPH